MPTPHDVTLSALSTIHGERIPACVALRTPVSRHLDRLARSILFLRHCRRTESAYRANDLVVAWARGASANRERNAVIVKTIVVDVDGGAGCARNSRYRVKEHRAIDGEISAPGGLSARGQVLERGITYFNGTSCTCGDANLRLRIGVVGANKARIVNVYHCQSGRTLNTDPATGRIVERRIAHGREPAGAQSDIETVSVETENVTVLDKHLGARDVVDAVNAGIARVAAVAK